MAAKIRIEKDTMGPFEVPADAYYGASTMRAVKCARRPIVITKIGAS